MSINIGDSFYKTQDGNLQNFEYNNSLEANSKYIIKKDPYVSLSGYYLQTTDVKRIDIKIKIKLKLVVFIISQLTKYQHNAILASIL